jgi:EmrB/QacA subfamily drug resistance transporter
VTLAADRIPLDAETRLVALIVAGAFFMQLLDSAIINTSLPQMAQTFGVLPLNVSIGVTIYMMAAATFMPLSAWLADRYGARNVLAMAIGLFTLASFACGMSRSLPQFVVARALQGIGAALMTPVGRLVVLRSTAKSQLIHAIALITWPALAAPVIAPALGGFITTYFSWRWNFLLNVPLGIAGVTLALRFIPNLRAAVAGLDWRGFGLSALALTVLLYGLDLLTHTPIDWVRSGACIGAGLLFAVLALRHFRRASAPLLQLASARVQTFALATFRAGTICRAGISATPFLLPLLFQLAFGMSALGAGELTLAYFVGNIGIKPMTTPILRRFGFRRVLVGNGLLAGAGIVACAGFEVQTSRALVVGVLVLAGMARSMQFTAQGTIAYADIDTAHKSSASALASVMEQVAAVLGVALGAIALNLSQLERHGSAISLLDFRFAFCVAGILVMLASLQFLRLPINAGAEVSGHPA